ncbi:DsbA family protein [Leucobacter allii]|uniref:DsbA family protein n=1 Tax=Leucobacter allii TaxID=2932247 RepID=UPI001FD2D165|nr:thioredoxin domain-containing protein [Leucobacter allii]UOR01506.1 DsbA family protein [Leucobacter allii]
MSSSSALETKYRRLRIITIVVSCVAVFLGLVVAAQAASPASRDTPGAGIEQGAPSEGSAVVRDDPDDPMAIGDPDAPITLVEWTDMRCPYCAVFNRDTMPVLIKEYVDSGKVRIEVNDVAFFGDQSRTAAVAVRAAGNQDMYFEYLSALYAAAPETGHPDLPRGQLIGFAEQIGIPDLERFTADLDDPELAQQVETSTSFAQQIGITGVPAFVVNNQLISGAQPIESFRQFLDAELAKTSQAGQ